MKLATIAEMMSIVEAIAQRSKDPKRKVGALVVNRDGSPLSWGYNGFVRGIADAEARLTNEQYKLAHIVHAEQNAVYNAAKMGISLEGGILLCNLHPCIQCSNAIIQAGISTIICPHRIDTTSKWWAQRAAATRLLEEAGIMVITVDDSYNIL